MTPQSSSSKLESEKALREIREKQLAHITPIVDALKKCMVNLVAIRSQHKLLSSVSLGLYEEVDKLAKKAPAEPVTDLVLTQVNDVIREIKGLVKDDPYVQRLQEFVPAGDNQEQRDFVVVLRQLRQGLQRFEETITPKITDFSKKLEEATTIKLALQVYLKGKRAVSPNDVDEFSFGHSKIWFSGHYGDEHFDWDRLDKIDFDTYFPAC